MDGLVGRPRRSRKTPLPVEDLVEVAINVHRDEPEIVELLNPPLERAGRVGVASQFLFIGFVELLLGSC